VSEWCWRCWRKQNIHPKYFSLPRRFFRSGCHVSAISQPPLIIESSNYLLYSARSSPKSQCDVYGIGDENYCEFLWLEPFFLLVRRETLPDPGNKSSSRWVRFNLNVADMATARPNKHASTASSQKHLDINPTQ
jgi:hypothetical protein